MSNNDEFGRLWREKYVKLLVLKKDFLEELIHARINGKSVTKIENNLDLVSLQIELHMIDHAIYYATESNTQPLTKNKGNFDVN